MLCSTWHSVGKSELWSLITPVFMNILSRNLIVSLVLTFTRSIPKIIRIGSARPKIRQWSEVSLLVIRDLVVLVLVVTKLVLELVLERCFFVFKLFIPL